MPTAFCEVFGIDKPIILAPMAGVVTSDLVAAVSNSGGLGMTPLWHVDVDSLTASICEIAGKTDKPFGVNLNMDFPSMEHLDACLEGGVSIISLFWHLREEYFERAKSAGAKIIYSVGNAAEARQAVEMGADAICAQGWEAGGHVRGTVATMALVPAVRDTVGDVPVIAAGGIADGRGMAAAFALGATAVWVGTRFLSATEAATHPEYLQRLIDATENDTAYFENLFNISWEDAPHRVLKNSTVAAWVAAGGPPPGQRPGEGDVLCRTDDGNDVLRYQSHTPRAGLEGNIEAVSMWAGQSAFKVQRQQTAAEIVEELQAEAADALRSAKAHF